MRGELRRNKDTKRRKEDIKRKEGGREGRKDGG